MLYILVIGSAEEQGGDVESRQTAARVWQTILRERTTTEKRGHQEERRHHQAERRAGEEKGQRSEGERWDPGEHRETAQGEGRGETMSNQNKINVKSMSNQCQINVKPMSNQCKLHLESVSNQCKVNLISSPFTIFWAVISYIWFDKITKCLEETRLKPLSWLIKFFVMGYLM